MGDGIIKSKIVNLQFVISLDCGKFQINRLQLRRFVRPMKFVGKPQNLSCVPYNITSIILILVKIFFALETFF